MLSMSFSLIMRSMLNLLCLNSVPSSIKRLINFSSYIFIGKTADDSPYFRTPSYRDFFFRIHFTLSTNEAKMKNRKFLALLSFSFLSFCFNL